MVLPEDRGVVSAYVQTLLVGPVISQLSMWEDNGTTGSPVQMRDVNLNDPAPDSLLAREAMARRLSKRNRPPRVSIYRTFR